MNNDWKDTFHHTQRERRGIFMLAFLLLLLLLLPYFLPPFQEPPTADFSEFKKDIAAFEEERLASEEATSVSQLFFFDPNTATKDDFIALGMTPKLAQRIRNYRKKGGYFYKKEDLKKIYGLEAEFYNRVAAYIQITPPKKELVANRVKKKTLHPFRFDPNTVSKQELSRMGLSQKVVQQLLNYRQKGGIFYKKEDVAKIYAITNTQYQQLEPFILIKKKAAQRKATTAKPTLFKTPTTYNNSTSLKIDINKASLADWQQLQGIGPYYAKKIVRFREYLGGFATRQQVGTTYGIPDTVFQKIYPHLLPSPIFRKLSINTAASEVLQKHPYIKKHQAKVIVNYRLNHGKYKKWKDVQKVKVFSKEELERLKPYLSY